MALIFFRKILTYLSNTFNRLLAVLIICLLLSGCSDLFDTETRNPNFAATLTLLSADSGYPAYYDHGETINLWFRSSISMNVTCYLENSIDSIYQVFPNSQRLESSIGAGQAVQISGGDRVRLIADANQPETVLCIGHEAASELPLDLHPQQRTLIDLVKYHRSLDSYLTQSQTVVVSRDRLSGSYIANQYGKSSSGNIDTRFEIPREDRQHSVSRGMHLFVLGVAAGILGILAFVPYIKDTVTRQNQPHRASWLIWSVLSSISFISQLFEGATSSLYYAAGQTFCTVLIFLLSVFFGVGKLLYRNDYLLLGLASIGVLLWYLCDTAAYALLISISISALAGLATVIKAYRDPESETVSAWALSCVASLFGILSVGSTDWLLLAYPVYLFVLYGTVLVAALLGKHNLRLTNLSSFFRWWLLSYHY